jgi:hypothetical protein
MPPGGDISRRARIDPVYDTGSVVVDFNSLNEKGARLILRSRSHDIRLVLVGQELPRSIPAIALEQRSDVDAG